jgi:hypothetical protein
MKKIFLTAFVLFGFTLSSFANDSTKSNSKKSNTTNVENVFQLLEVANINVTNLKYEDGMLCAFELYFGDEYGGTMNCGGWSHQNWLTWIDWVLDYLQP